MKDPLERIAAALERLAPPPPPAPDLTAHPAYVWHTDKNGRGSLTPARAFAPLPLAELVGIDPQKATVLENVRRLANRLPAHDTLLWGARGTGKSALSKAAVAAIQAEGGSVALIEAQADTLDTLPALFALIADAPRAFVIFLDDLGFDAASDGRALRSLLEGGAEARPANARLFVTSNRRHLIPRSLEEQASAINVRDSIDDNLALADRFGLSLGFHAIDQDTYVEIVRTYAQDHGLPFDAAEAINWATRRGSRSGRVAWQYVVDLAGRNGKAL